jgi:hypothetical protein
MTPGAVSDIAAQAKSILLRIRDTPLLTDSDRLTSQRLVEGADRLEAIFRDADGVPAPARFWITSLRSLVAQGQEIRRRGD